MIKVIIFDFDGVIADSVDIKTKAFAKLFKDKGKEIVNRVVSYHLAHTGISRYEKFHYIYKEILHNPLSKRMLKTLCRRFEDLVIDSVIKAPYIRGTREFLQNFVSRYRYFIVSATPQKEIEKIVRRRNIGALFGAIYGAPIKKSDAVRSIRKREKIKVTEVLYVGDALSDYRAAKDNSVKFVAVVQSKDSSLKNIDCPKIRNLTELDSVIRKI